LALVAGLVAFRVIGALSQASWDGGRRRVLCVDETEVGNQLVLSGYLPHVVERGSSTQTDQPWAGNSHAEAAPMRHMLTTKDLNELQALSC